MPAGTLTGHTYLQRPRLNGRHCLGENATLKLLIKAEQSPRGGTSDECTALQERGMTPERERGRDEGWWGGAREGGGFSSAAAAGMQDSRGVIHRGRQEEEEEEKRMESMSTPTGSGQRRREEHKKKKGGRSVR